MSPADSPGGSTGWRRWLGRTIDVRLLPLVAVGLLLVAEVGVRGVEDWLPLSQAGDAAEVELKYRQIVDLERAGETTDIVFFGNSAMDSAIDPAVWGEESTTYPLPYNASLLGQPFDSMRRWAADFVLPRTDPALVVVGVTPYDVPQIDVIDTNRALVERLFDDAMDGLAPGPTARADAQVQEFSALARNRAAFRSPVRLYRATRQRITNAEKPKQDSIQPVVLQNGETVARTAEVWEQELMQPRGGVANYWGIPTSMTVGFTFDNEVQRQIFRSSRTTAAQMQALRDAAHHVDSEVIFVVPPTLPDAYTGFTGSRAETAAAVAHIRDSGTRLGVRVIDFSEVEYPPDHFADPVHLNRQGSARFSAELAAVLDQR